MSNIVLGMCNVVTIMKETKRGTL